MPRLARHRERPDYGTAQKKGETLGSGAMKSTCRGYEVRFNPNSGIGRSGRAATSELRIQVDCPCWSQTGDEAWMGLETVQRNGRWHLLCPHAQGSDPAHN